MKIEDRRSLKMMIAYVQFSSFKPSWAVFPLNDNAHPWQTEGGQRSQLLMSYNLFNTSWLSCHDKIAFLLTYPVIHIFSVGIIYRQR
mgnify:CR=1